MDTDIAWLLLIVAGLLEPVWVYAMERSDGFKKPSWLLAMTVVLVADIYMLSVVMKSLGPGISYAVWTGIGAVFTFLMGVAIYKEKVTAVRCALIMTIVAGIVGINLTTGGN